METKLERISQMSRENPKMIFTSIGHLINKEMLKSCHETMDGTKAKGIDGVSKEEYEKKVKELHDLYIACSKKLPDYRFYLPIMKDDDWRIRRYYSGVFKEIGYDEFQCRYGVCVRISVSMSSRIYWSLMS